MDELIEKTVELVLEKELIEVKNKIIVDSIYTNAMFSYISPREELIRQAKLLRKSVYKTDEIMHNKMPKKYKTKDTLFFGYKTHIAMTPERIITSASITSGEKHNGKELVDLIEKSEQSEIRVEAIIGDGSYSEEETLKYCNEKNIKKC